MTDSMTDRMTDRLRITIAGAVQGVGFRPFIYRLATELGITGWVSNTAQGVLIEAQAPEPCLQLFVTRITQEPPPHSFIRHMDTESLPANGDTASYTQFEIRHSQIEGTTSAIVLPDLATCPECLAEMFDPANRRYLYPFTNCTHCGPRFTIIEGLPYDRPATTMRAFTMCPDCRAEYENPLDRRFHAQPNACPTCGPQIALWGMTGRVLADRHDALLAAANVIRKGGILAVKGLGGFHLMVDARSHSAVSRLRALKHREEKPLAVMYPSLEMIQCDCEVSPLEEQLLTSAEAPIVLLRHSEHNCAMCVSSVAPGNPYRGVMLPYTPLHHLLMAELGFPVVATSGNLSGEPICIDEDEAVVRLHGIADAFLIHNRPITRHADDSVVRVVAGRPMLMRRARGFAPLPIDLSHLPEPVVPIFAAGAHLKNTLAIARGDQVFVSQHIGDMETPEAFHAYKRTVKSFEQLYNFEPAAVACDLHPDYRSTHYAAQYAKTHDVPLIPVQHHYAHILACMAEHKLSGPVLGVAWDGTGYGTDGTIWGGEFLLITETGFERFAHFRPFRLPGGDRAVEEPRRVALGMLYEIYGDNIPPDLIPIRDFAPHELSVLKTALRKGINAPFTSSVGRLFDGVAALCGLRQRVNFEGQAAMDLEFALGGADSLPELTPDVINRDERYPYSVTDITGEEGLSGRIIEWRPMVESILDDLAKHTPTQQISARFHHTLAAIIADVALKSAIKQVILSGGCFQNVALLESTIGPLTNAGLHPYWPEQLPPNDGGIAVGQIMAAARQLSRHLAAGSAARNG